MPDRLFLADRMPNGEWRRVTYREARDLSRAIAQYLIDHKLSADRPVVILSGNSVNHGLVALGCMTAGIPYAPIAPAYSTKSKDFDKLHHVFDLITPGMVFAEHIELYKDAIRAVVQESVPVFGTGDLSTVPGARNLNEILSQPATDAVDIAISSLGPETIAKFLFTSGSTGKPKAVINTQGMISANQVMIRDTLAFLKDEPPVLVDWLPWNHTAGGNHNFGIALFNGGSLYIDDGAPTPIGIHKTVHNLLDIAPTLYFNVPKGYEMLVEHLRSNETLRKRFFSRVKVLQYAGASLADHVFKALEDLAMETVGEKIMIITGYGSTETGPFLSTTVWPVSRPGEIGLPAAGSEMKLVPNGEKMEVRVKGASITPGYWRQPDKTKEAFDEEGYYLMQDALRYHDPNDIAKGLLFDGRVTEDFKLDTGTWVNMASVRGATIRGWRRWCGTSCSPGSICHTSAACSSSIMTPAVASSRSSRPSRTRPRLRNIRRSSPASSPASTSLPASPPALPPWWPAPLSSKRRLRRMPTKSPTRARSTSAPSWPPAPRIARHSMRPRFRRMCWWRTGRAEMSRPHPLTPPPLRSADLSPKGRG